MTDKRKILSPGEGAEKNFDPIWGNMLHTHGEDKKADQEWNEMMRRQEHAQEMRVIEYERQHAKEFGVLEEFEKYVAEGRFREFMPRLNLLKVQRERQVERKVYFGIGVAVGFIIASLIWRW